MLGSTIARFYASLAPVSHVSDSLSAFADLAIGDSDSDGAFAPPVSSVAPASAHHPLPAPAVPVAPPGPSAVAAENSEVVGMAGDGTTGPAPSSNTVPVRRVSVLKKPKVPPNWKWFHVPISARYGGPNIYVCMHKSHISAPGEAFREDLRSLVHQFAHELNSEQVDPLAPPFPWLKKNMALRGWAISKGKPQSTNGRKKLIYNFSGNMETEVRAVDLPVSS